MPSRLRRPARLAAIAALAVSGSLAATSAANAAPALTVSTANGAGGSVVVSGTDFAQSYNAGGRVTAGFYLAQGVVSGGTVELGTASKWISAGNAATSGRDALATDGSFSTTLPVATTLDGGAVDCKVTTCEVVTWPAQSNPVEGTLIARATLAFGPSLVVTPTSVTAPDAVAVTGSGFATSYDAGGRVTAGFSVVQAALSGGSVTYNTADGGSKWLNPANTAPTAGQDKLQSDGSFSTTLPSVATLDGGNIDCSVAGKCFFMAWPAQSNPTLANMIVLSSPTTVAAAVPPSDPGTGGGGGGSSPSVSASPTSGLSTAGPTTVSVTGSGFSPAANTGVGIYVMYGPVTATLQSQFYASKWIAAGNAVAADTDAMSGSGTFATTLAVAPAYTDGSGTFVNCTVVQCAIRTIAAHQYGATDRSQDTSTAISFAGDPVASQPDAPVTAPDLVPTTAPTTAANATTLVGPKLTKVAVGQRGKVSMRVSEPSTVTFTVRRKVGKHYVVVKTVAVTAKTAGAISANLKITKKGLYRITVQAKGSDGATKTVVKSLRVT
jgi:hypothetical protein